MTYNPQEYSLQAPQQSPPAPEQQGLDAESLLAMLGMDPNTNSGRLNMATTAATFVIPGGVAVQTLVGGICGGLTSGAQCEDGVTQLFVADPRTGLVLKQMGYDPTDKELNVAQILAEKNPGLYHCFEDGDKSEALQKDVTTGVVSTALGFGAMGLVGGPVGMVAGAAAGVAGGLGVNYMMPLHPRVEGLINTLTNYEQQLGNFGKEGLEQAVLAMRNPNVVAVVEQAAGSVLGKPVTIEELIENHVAKAVDARQHNQPMPPTLLTQMLNNPVINAELCKSIAVTEEPGKTLAAACAERGIGWREMMLNDITMLNAKYYAQVPMQHSNQLPVTTTQSPYQQATQLAGNLKQYGVSGASMAPLQVPPASRRAAAQGAEPQYYLPV
ncbi:MAG: hypothetical protein JO089_02430 [Alphaproteobacteria bacterium]|nr:hypothetical protein [Alphaproteobacteria bacterium]